MNTTDTRTATRQTCPRCGIRLVIDAEVGLCLICLDREHTGRQVTLGQGRL
jgi:hypothetical protein